MWTRIIKTGLVAASTTLCLAAAACVSEPQGLTEAEVERAQNLDLPEGAQPEFFSFDEPPVLQNRSEMARLVKRNYPAGLRSEGVGGTAVLWIHIDEQGETQHVVLNKSSGNEALDNAALATAEGARFSPASNQGEPTEVWIAIPIQFEPKDM